MSSEPTFASAPAPNPTAPDPTAHASPAPAPTTAGAPDLDRTVMIPTPGGRRPDGEVPRPAADATRLLGGGPASAAAAPALRPGRNAGLNPLLDPALPLLDLLAELRTTIRHDDPAALRERVSEQLRRFEVDARARSQSPEAVYTARYLLCTAIDEVVLGHAWGAQSAWATRNLLSTFHKEVSGGETFFQLLETLSQDPASNRHMLELMLVLLGLGFEGRYRMRPNGREALADARERLHGLLRQSAPEPEPALSPHWQGLGDAGRRLAAYVPLWVLGAAAAALLLGGWFAFSQRLAGGADPVAARLYELGRAALVIEREPPVVAAPRPLLDLPTVLADEIASGKVAVENRREGQAVVIRGDNLFGSGSASVNPAYRELIARIGLAIKAVDGRALVTGHSDNVPIRSVRFPSNFALSQARADGVARLLAGPLGTPERVIAEGRADTEPLAPNTTRANRARNRRVEILASYRGYRPADSRETGE